MKKISIIVTSERIKSKTLSSLKFCPYKYELIISKTKGLGKARNSGANKATSKILVFFDDDLTIYPKIWNTIINIKRGTFIMASGGSAHGGTPEPITQVLIIYKKDFLKVNGFENKITASGEDREFFMNAIKKGLIPYYLPQKIYRHNPHPIRFKHNRKRALTMMYEHAKVLATHGAYTRIYKNYLRWFFPYIYKKEPTIKLYGAKIFWTSIRNLFAILNILTHQKYRRK